MKYIASCSFGKDSIAAILTRLKHNEPVDMAVYARIMYDDEISAELPEHEEWIHSYAIPKLKADYGIETKIVQADYGYKKWFYRKFEKGKRKGEIYGFPYLKGAWCNSQLKVAPLKKFQRTMGEYREIIGIAADEPNRAIGKGIGGGILPLVEYNVIEKEAFEICRQAKLQSPAYKNGVERLGCWFCHNQRLNDLRMLRKDYPDRWEIMQELERASPTTFTTNWTIAGLEKRFDREDRQICMFDEGMIWQKEWA